MNKICRICLEEGVLSSIFAKDYNIALSDMIDFCSNITIMENDGLPEQICSNCIYKLGIAYQFKQTSQRSDMRLRQYLGLQIKPKLTDASVMTDSMVTRCPTIITKCNCKLESWKKYRSNYKRKSESEKLKRGPKPKPKKIHSCAHCSKEFRCEAQLQTHVRTHTGDKPFVCMYCPRSFSQKHNLTIHLRLHTGEKPFQCEVCSKTFSAQGNLNAHLKIHSGQRDHVCEVCNKSFITSSELCRHMHKHTKVKNFKCDLCGTAYAHNRDLKLHKIKKHQLLTSEQKSLNEAYNNSNNIDIIGLDEVNTTKVGSHFMIQKDDKQSKADSHFMHHSDESSKLQGRSDGNFLHPSDDNKHQDKVGVHFMMETHDKPNYLIKSENQLLYDQKVKEFHQFTGKTEVESHNCTICGEVFNCVVALAQHCLNHHKGYTPLETSKTYI